MEPSTILNFWFKELSPAQWFTQSEELDEQIRQKFGKVHQMATQGELSSWRQDAHGRLAEIIVLDQFSRNIYRNTPLAFAQDSQALILAQELVVLGLDKKLTVQEKAFAYMPYMHSESAKIHIEAERLYSISGLEENLKFELQHKTIIDTFGRYPHRNTILGRESTPSEIEFLKLPNSSF